MEGVRVNVDADPVTRRPGREVALGACRVDDEVRLGRVAVDQKVARHVAHEAVRIEGLCDREGVVRACREGLARARRAEVEPHLPQTEGPRKQRRRVFAHLATFGCLHALQAAQRAWDDY